MSGNRCSDLGSKVAIADAVASAGRGLLYLGLRGPVSDYVKLLVLTQAKQSGVHGKGACRVDQRQIQ